MIRVLFIARYLQMVNHRKVQTLAQQPDIDLWHLAPHRWTDAFRTYEQELRQGDGYRLLIASTLGGGDIHRFVYWPPTLFLKQVRPDIIHLEEEPDSLVALETVVARKLLAPSAKLVLFTWQNIRRERRAAVEALSRFVLRQVDHAIAGNAEAVTVLRQQGYQGPVTLLPQLGVDTRTFKLQGEKTIRHDLGLETEFVVGYAGRFVPQKGLDTLIRAVARVPGVHLLLLGSGPMEHEIEILARSLGVDDRLTIISAVHHHCVPDYLNGMDLLVLPSQTTPQWKEQFGHVLIEAMACGTPVVGSDSGAIPEVIGPAGLTFPEGDHDALAERLAVLKRNPGKLRAMRQSGLQRVARLYTHQRIAERTARVYRSVITESTRAGQERNRT